MDDVRVEMVGHASLRVHAHGKTMLTDPWYVDPINCNTIFHWPPLIHDVAALARQTDAIYVSHVHPDHLNADTLRQFPRSIPIYIGDFTRKQFRDEIRALGFTAVEVPFQTPVAVEGTPFNISILESDYAESAAYDSSCVIQAPDFTVFNNNDCYLKQPKYEWVRDKFTIDYGFLGFSPASYFPITFEFDEAKKDMLLRGVGNRRYEDYLSVARMLRPVVSVPFAMGIRFLHASMLWQNRCYNRATEAVKRAAVEGLRGEALMPGDCILADHSIRRTAAAPEPEEEDRLICAYAAEKQAWIQSRWDQEEPARPGLTEQFRRHVESLWSLAQERFPTVRANVIAYRLTGPQQDELHFDFSATDIFRPGPAPRFDMRFTYPDHMLQACLDGKIDWDELHFSNRLSVAQNVYPAEFFAMLRQGSCDQAALPRVGL